MPYHDTPLRKRIPRLFRRSLLCMTLLCVLSSAGECAEVVRVAGNADNPPLTFLDEDGAPSGYDVDVITLLGQITGVEISLDLLPWPEAQRRFREGSAELLLGLNITPDREALFNFTPPHFESHLVLFTPPSSSFEGLEDLFGRRIGVARSTVAEEVMRQRHPEIQLWTFASQPKAMEALLQGQVDAVLGSAAAGRWWILENSAFSRVSMAAHPLRRTPYAMALHKGNEELLEKLRSGLLSLQKQGDLQRLREIWMQQQHSKFAYLRHPYVLWFFLGGGRFFFLLWGAPSL